MLKYKNFVPRQTNAEGFFSEADYEDFDAAVAAADAWIERTGVDVIQIETVVLPNIFASGEKGPNDSYLKVRTSDGSRAHWHQFLRIWYRK